jgi:hypothetical protein
MYRKKYGPLNRWNSKLSIHNPRLIPCISTSAYKFNLKNVWSSRSSPVRERHPATWGARPLRAHRRRHGVGPLDAAGDLVTNGWPRPVDADGT